MVAETEAASAVLREHLPDLRARLESQGMQIERLDVETEQLEHGFDARQDADSRWQPPQQQRGSHGGFTTEQVASIPGETKSHAASADPAAAIVSSANRGVDVQL